MPELIWEGKDAVINYHHSLPVRELKIDQQESLSPEPSLDDNLIIEGDNIEVLKSLIPKFASKIDVIYIDPPYNTGNENWVYNDNLNSPQIKSWLGNVVGKEDLQRHDKWLCMMYPRLVLARELLSESGVIFISINEEEVFDLKLLCDEIFNVINYQTTFTIKVRHEDRILKGDKDYHEVVEYLLFYSKSSEYKAFKRSKDNSSIEEYIYNVEEINTKPETKQLGSKLVEVFKPNEYKISKSEPEENKLKKISIRGSIKDGNSSGRFYTSYLEKLAKEMPGCLFKVPDMGADNTPYRYFLTPEGKKINGDYFQGIPIERKEVLEIPYPNFFDFEADFNDVGYEGGIEFRNGKKPISFIKKIFELSNIKNNPDSIILDFFAGSGTTGHAVLEMNKEDSGNRKFILVQQPEESEEASKQNFKNIFEITTARIRRCIEGVKTAKDPKLQEGLGGSFTVVKLGEALHLNTLFLEKNLPSYEALASYLFYHTTNQALNNVTENTSHYIGKTENYKLYLIYSADKEKLKHADYALSRSKLEEILKDCANGYQALIYAVTIYVDNKSIKSLMEKEKYTKKPIICQIPYQYLQINSANVLNNLEDSED
jgi:adenine-specific DNA-methyltransferase